MGRLIRSHRQLDVYRNAFEAAMHVFELSASFPSAERYSLTDQIRRSSRAVAANVAEAWRQRRYPAMFVSKLAVAESEAAETQVWIEFAVRCGYAQRPVAADLYRAYERLVKSLVVMSTRAHEWTRSLSNAPATRTRRPPAPHPVIPSSDHLGVSP